MELVPAYKAKSKKGTPLTRKQQADLIIKIAKDRENAIGNKDKLEKENIEFLFAMYLYTGARRSEVLALDWTNINIEENYIEILTQIDDEK